jgi:hypothetical protein
MYTEIGITATFYGRASEYLLISTFLLILMSGNHTVKYGM